MNAKEFLTPDQLVDRWAGALTRRTLANWRAQGKGPTFHKVGPRVVYRVTDIESYEAKSQNDGAQ